eukprot:CAMPEP_0195591710 /NCGR_PEP_ID=MMETSP0814-20130614/34780_1 /TAXON_ID=97485 /ORGANISM="Prymnesium parvum, Strain Texoma1" /LENGTH=77 /DNA_ID=CAMNT_0040730755 /DNA_START=616 /DNA_END=849 /DNA_ORIENTATION=+
MVMASTPQYAPPGGSSGKTNSNPNVVEHQHRSRESLPAEMRRGAIWSVARDTKVRCSTEMLELPVSCARFRSTTASI